MKKFSSKILVCVWELWLGHYTYAHTHAHAHTHIHTRTFLLFYYSNCFLNKQISWLQWRKIVHTATWTYSRLCSGLGDANWRIHPATCRSSAAPFQVCLAIKFLVTMIKTNKSFLCAHQQIRIARIGSSLPQMRWSWLLMITWIYAILLVWIN